MLVALVLVLVFNANKPVKTSPQQTKKVEAAQKQQAVIYGVPVKLKIPKISVDAAVSLVGLTQGGDMQAPTGGQEVGWYKMGARPGNNGTAVIAGHYGQWENGEGSVFDNLNKLQKGDEIYIQDENDATVAFVVRELKLYKQDQKDPAVFNFASDGKAYLTLITCQGAWNAGQSSYSDRLVVFAERS